MLENLRFKQALLSHEGTSKMCHRIAYVVHMPPEQFGDAFSHLF